jgi:roadblock/LC7 domain-containing protein
MAIAFHVDEQMLGNVHLDLCAVAVTTNGCHLAEVTQEKGRFFLFHDGQSKGDAPASNVAPRIAVSPDGQRVAFALFDSGTTMITVNGVVAGRFRGLCREDLGFSPDGGSWAASIQTDRGAFVVVNGVAQEEFFAVTGVKFSPDGKRIAYAAKKDGKWIVVDNGVHGPPFDQVNKGHPDFSPTGVLYYAVVNNGRQFVVINGIAGPEFETVAPDTIRFSLDGKHVAYAVGIKSKLSVAVDGVAGPIFDRILRGGPSLNCDGSHVAYAAASGGETVMLMDHAPLVGSEGSAGDAEFSLDGKQFAYCKKRAGSWHVVLNGVAGEGFSDGILTGTLVFSNDGDLFAYGAQRSGKRHIVVSGICGDGFDRIWKPVFAQRGKSFAYRASSAGRWFAVLNGTAGSAYEGIIDGGPVFRDEKEIEYLTVRGGKMFRVRQSSTVAA